MTLPILNTSKFELELPSTGEKIEYRPFLVKEEKILLIAQESGDEQEILKAVESIIEECCFKKIDPKLLPIFDLEYIFIQLRAKSIGEVSEVTIKCPDDGETEVKIEIDLNDVKCIKSEDHSNKIELTDDIGVIMSYPRISNISGFKDEGSKSVFEIIKSCIEQIYDQESVYHRNDMSDKELDSFINSMSHQQFMKIQSFFDTAPKVQYKTKIKNPKTKVSSDLVIEGLQNFF